MINRGRLAARLAALSVLAVAGSSLIPLHFATAQVVVPTRADEACGPASGTQARNLAFPATHVAVHWDGHPEAEVQISFSRDGKSFGETISAERDEVGEQRHDGRTYGAVLVVDDAVSVRIETDRVVGRLCVLAMADGEPKVERRVVPPGRPAGAAVAQPAITPRSGWGADESLRFKGGKEIWPPEFYQVKKLLVHHTATKNRDRDPKATLRSIYRYHAVTQGWGDIGYNYLIDETGTIYKGRHSHNIGESDDRITGDDSNGKGVRAGHAFGFNVGTVGVALLGTLTKQDATAKARSALESFLAWEASVRGIADPAGSSDYVNEVDPQYYKVNMPNIAGHRDVNETACPGGAFYDTLPTIRKNVAAILAASGGTATQ